MNERTELSIVNRVCIILILNNTYLVHTMRAYLIKVEHQNPELRHKNKDYKHFKLIQNVSKAKINIQNNYKLK